MDRSKKIGGPSEVVERKVEEKRLARLALLQIFVDRGVISGAVLDGMVEDRRIRGEAGYRQLFDVALQRAGLQQIACNVVQPDDSGRDRKAVVSLS